MFVKFCGEEFDKSILRVPSFPVNMRLMKEQEHYNETIKLICKNLANKTIELKCSMVAAPTIGYPFRIIYGKIFGIERILINPKVIDCSKSTMSSKTNCPCIDLKESISCNRHEWISIEAYSLELQKIKIEKINASSGGFALQHELNHLDGILITDFSIEEKLDNMWKDVPGV